MNQHVFVALAVVLGVVVQGLPQHRFQPFHFAFTAGKHDSVSTGMVGETNTRADRVIPIEEPVPVQEESTLTTVDEAQAIETPVYQAPPKKQVNQLWRKAAMNLVNIPHLLRWVSSLNSEALMTTIGDQQGVVVSDTQNAATEAPEPVTPQGENVFHSQNNQDVGIVENIETVTNLYETDYTTEEPQLVQEEMVVNQPQEVQEEVAAPVQTEIEPQQYEPVQEMIPSTEPKQVEGTVTDQPTAQVEQVVYAEPEPVEAIAPAESEPVIETNMQMENAAEAHRQLTEERAYVQPEPIEEVQQYVQPREERRRTYVQEEPIEEVRQYVQPQEERRRTYVQPEPTEEVQQYVQPQEGRRRGYVQAQEERRRAYVQAQEERRRTYVQSEPIEEVEQYVQPQEERRTHVQPEPIEEVQQYVQPQEGRRRGYVQAQKERRRGYVQAQEERRRSYVQPEPIEEVQQYVQPQEVRRERVWQQQDYYQRPVTPTFEKPALIENKKNFPKFKSNKHDIRKQQSLNKGKTLLNFPAAPQESVFSFQSFAYPAYSYSVSHMPSRTHHTGR